MSGVPELLILRLVADREMYGYEITRAIADATNREIELGEGVLYPALHALERSACLATRRTRVNGRPRIYYRITRRGRARLEETASEWTRISTAMAQALRGPLRGALSP
jgi:PadR family transcriptional regulator PadR